MSVEVEMSAMAASRRTEEQLNEVNRTLEQLESKLLNGESTEKADFAFHLAIAKASNNEYFIRLINYLADKSLPKHRIIDKLDKAAIEEFKDQYRLIAKSILYQDPELARTATKNHLTSCIKQHINFENAIGSAKQAI